MRSGLVESALKPGGIYTEGDLNDCFMEATGMSEEEAAITRIQMLMEGSLVLEPGKTDDDARFRRVKLLPGRFIRT